MPSTIFFVLIITQERDVYEKVGIHIEFNDQEIFRSIGTVLPRRSHKPKLIQWKTERAYKKENDQRRMKLLNK